MSQLTDTDRKWLAWLITVALVVVGTVIGVQFPIPPTPDPIIQAAGTTNLDALTLATGLTVTSGGATITAGGLTVTAGGETITAGGLTVTDGGITISDDNLVVADDLRVAAQTAISVTMNGYITPTGTYQQLESAGTVNTASIAAGTAGDLLVLINTTNTSIVLTDTGTLKLGGNRTLGQYDSLTLWSDGTNWIELATTNN